MLSSPHIHLPPSHCVATLVVLTRGTGHSKVGWKKSGPKYPCPDFARIAIRCLAYDLASRNAFRSLTFAAQLFSECSRSLRR